MELQQQAPSPSSNGAASDQLQTELAGQQTLPPLNVSGMVITKADLLAALRLWVPQVWDVSPLGDDRFVLEVGPVDPAKARR